MAPVNSLQVDEWMGELNNAATAGERGLALDRLGLMGGETALRAYELALRDPDVELRLAAVRKLSATSGWQNDSSFQLLMQEALYDTDPRVADYARSSIEVAAARAGGSAVRNP